MSERPESYLVRVNSTSGGGDATSAPIWGLLSGIYLNFHASAAAGTVTTIEAITPQGETIPLLTLTSVNTDGYYPLAYEAKGPTGVGLGVYMPFVLTGSQIKVTVASDGSTTPAREDAVRAIAFVL